MSFQLLHLPDLKFSTHRLRVVALPPSPQNHVSCSSHYNFTFLQSFFTGTHRSLILKGQEQEAKAVFRKRTEAHMFPTLTHKIHSRGTLASSLLNQVIDSILI